MPPDYLIGLLYSIETTIRDYAIDNPKIIDKDVEYIYEKLERYFKVLSTGKSIDEPSSTNEDRETLINNLLDTLELREEEAMDSDFIDNPTCLSNNIPIKSLNHLYVIGFKRLAKSTKLWRKKDGRKGYINFIIENVV